MLKLVHNRDDLPQVMGVIAVSQMEQGQEFVNSYGLNFPMVILDRQQYHKLGIRQVPTAILLQDGVIQEKWLTMIPKYFVERIRQGKMIYAEMK